MVRIGLTGGIASGKTLVADELGRLGARVIDADVLARQVVEPGSVGLQEIITRFGGDVLRSDGSLDRARLGEIVFGDREAREDLNAIIHPRVRAEARRLEELAQDDDVVVHVIPLLVETGQHDDFDAVMVVDVPVALQIERLTRRNDLTLEQARTRVAAQASRSQRVAAATWVVDNSGDPEGTRAMLRELWNGPIAAM
ncbi:MAG: dephospho-CoA kinase [Propionibacteriaceae bacterium]|nr:dephospho-CoA kinase [Propionibacteriaceae bacterium]